MAYREPSPEPPRPADRPRHSRLSPYVRVALWTVVFCPLSGASCGAASSLRDRSGAGEGFFVGLALALAVVLIATVCRIAQEEG